MNEAARVSPREEGLAVPLTSRLSLCHATVSRWGAPVGAGRAGWRGPVPASAAPGPAGRVGAASRFIVCLRLGCGLRSRPCFFVCLVFLVLV